MIEMNLEFEPTKAPIGDQLGKAVDGFIQEVLDRIIKYALENLKRNQSWVTGHLAKSGRVDYNRALFEGEIVFSAPYSAFVEYGTAPHIAPLGKSLPHTKKGKVIVLEGVPDPTTNPLDYWAYRKGFREAISTKYGVHTKLGYGVWLKIMNRGSDPHPYLRPAIDRVRAEVNSIAKKYGLEFS